MLFPFCSDGFVVKGVKYINASVPEVYAIDRDVLAVAHREENLYG
jgi:hypothetical protein